MVEILIAYEGGLRCSAVHGPSGTNIQTDAPVDNHGQGAAFSPTDLTATSLGVCMMTVMGIAAKPRGIELCGTRLIVKKHMSQHPPRRIAAVDVDLFLPIPSDHPDRGLLEKSGRECPVALSLHPDIKQSITFHWGVE
jgi:uncharacterized OsmC-like protein